ncbi:MAG: secreted hydrolase, partial [Myxococcales bacterium]|nr:secreted hydrolase [Myxococcales bacterium]
AGASGGSGGQGSAGPDGGAAGSTRDGGGDLVAGAPSCGGVFCEDFELGQIDPAKWSAPAMGGATMTVQTKTVAHGKYAVQFHGAASPASSDYVYIITKNAPAALRKHSFGRAYLYLSPQRNDIDMGLVFAGTAGFPKPTYMSIANHGTGWQLGFIKLSGSPGGETQTYPPGDIPVAKWTCLEWELNDDPDEMNVWGDDKPIGTLNKDSKVGFCSGGCSQPASLFDNENSGLIGAFTDFGFGFYDWHPMGRPAFDLYYDDVVLSTERVGCLP